MQAFEIGPRSEGRDADNRLKAATRDPVAREGSSEALLHTLPIHSIVDASSAAALARRAALAIGLEGTGPWSVAIAASELATNIARHTHSGELRMYAGQGYVKLVAEDRGPSFANAEDAMIDGHSRGRLLGVDDRPSDGMGCGLGAVGRLMDRLEIHSAPGAGARVIAIKSSRRDERALAADLGDSE